ncbi:MAG: nickel-dependent lactate racemase [Dethiobacteria bacterium]|jgi:nickel-dependent lactate racemase|nr:nickel-dependent lactate racemase [Bacillota bacterium]
MRFKYGKKTLELPLEGLLQYKELKLKDTTPLKDPHAEILRALRRPTSGKPLKERVCKGESVCILVNDPTRVARTELFMPLLLAELNEAGIEDEQITAVFTIGSHRPVTAGEMRRIVGEEAAARILLLNHEPDNEHNLTYLGDTARGTPVKINSIVASADRRILTGSIIYHFFAGFGGGRKALVPGVAAMETIQANHRLMLEEGARLGVLEGNPVHEDLLEAANMVGADFLLNVVLNEEKELLAVFSGDMQEAHRRGCSFVEEVYGVPITKKADLVIASCGGYPKDINIYQSQKTLENAAQAVRDGGVIILLAECAEGAGSAVYEQWAKRYRRLPEMEAALRNNFQLGGHKAYAISRVLSRCQVFLVSDLEQKLAAELGFKAFGDPEGALRKAMLCIGGNLVTYIMPEGALTTPVFNY